MKNTKIKKSINKNSDAPMLVNDKFDVYDILKLSKNKDFKFYKKNEILFRENTKPLGLYYLIDGKVKIYRSSHNENGQILRFALPGDIFGINEIFTGNNYITSSSAIENSFVYLIPTEDFIELIKNNSNISYYLIYTLCKLKKKIDNRTISIIQKTEKERLAETLLILSNKFNSDTINILKKDLANFSYINKNKLKPYLSEFKENKLINLDSERIRIRDAKGLKRMTNVLCSA